jgi:hypothetical protein
MIGIFTEHLCRKSLIWNSKGLDDDSCNRIVSSVPHQQGLAILIGDAYAV